MKWQKLAIGHRRTERFRMKQRAHNKKRHNTKKKYYLMSKNISLQGRGICHYQRLRATRIHTAPLLPYNIFLFSSLSFNVLLCSLSQFSSDSEETSGENETTDKTYEDEEKKQRRDVNQSYKQIAKKRLGLCATFLFVTLESNNDNDDDNEEPKKKNRQNAKTSVH